MVDRHIEYSADVFSVTARCHSQNVLGIWQKEPSAVLSTSAQRRTAMMRIAYHSLYIRAGANAPTAQHALLHVSVERVGRAVLWVVCRRHRSRRSVCRGVRAVWLMAANVLLRMLVWCIQLCVDVARQDVLHLVAVHQVLKLTSAGKNGEREFDACTDMLPCNTSPSIHFACHAGIWVTTAQELQIVLHCGSKEQCCAIRKRWSTRTGKKAVSTSFFCCG